MPTGAVVLDYTPYEKGSYMSFRGGINAAVSDELIKDNEVSTSTNFIPDILNPLGGIIKRDGVTKHLANQQTQVFRSIYQGHNAVYFTGTTLCKIADNTTIFTAGSATNNWDWTTWSDTSVNRDLFVNAFDAPQKTAGTAGTTAVIAGSPPVSRCIKTFHNMVFIVPSGGTNASCIVRWSDLGTFETWPAVNAFTVTSASDMIIGLMPFNDKLMVMCERKFFHISGSSQTDINIPYSSYEEGAASHRAIVPTPYGLFWWGRSGSGLLHSEDGFGGSSIDKPLLRKIPNTLANIAGNLNFVHGFWNPKYNRVEMYIPQTTGNTIDLGIFYYPEDDAVWFQDSDGTEMSASAWVVSSIAGASVSGAPVALLGSQSATGYLYKQSGEDDDGTAIGAAMETRRETTEFGPGALKFCDYVQPTWINQGTGSMTLSYYLDDSTTAAATTYTLSTAGTDATLASKYIGLNKNFRKLKFRVVDGLSVRTQLRSLMNYGHLVSS